MLSCYDSKILKFQASLTPRILSFSKNSNSFYITTIFRFFQPLFHPMLNTPFKNSTPCYERLNFRFEMQHHSRHATYARQVNLSLDRSKIFPLSPHVTHPGVNFRMLKSLKLLVPMITTVY